MKIEDEIIEGTTIQKTNSLLTSGLSDPLDPPEYLRKLEYVRPDAPRPLSPYEREKAKQWTSEIFRRVDENNPLP